MATTTNFGWETPDDTDLVKDGALAMRTLGNAIDTSLVDLKGGTTGQVLSKTSNTDMDFTWVTSDDANAIQNAIVDAKGDLITATAADTPARLAVGTNGQVLTVDSTTATGLKWATASSASTFVGCSVYPSGLQTVSNDSWTAINWGAEFFDSNSFHDNTTNNTRLTIPSGKGGYYFIGATVGWNDNGTGVREHKIYLNGAAYSPIRAYTSVWNAGSGKETVAYIATILSLSAGDYIEVYGRQTSGGNLSATTVGNFSISLLGA